MSYPGAATDVKAYMYIWKSMWQPILRYGSDCISLGKLGKQTLETSQANLLKQCLGLSKRCHSTDLLKALNVKRITDLSAQNYVNLLRRVFNIHSPLQSLCAYFISCMISNETVITGTLVERVLQCDFSPVKCAFNFIRWFKNARLSLQ